MYAFALWREAGANSTEGALAMAQPHKWNMDDGNMKNP